MAEDRLPPTPRAHVIGAGLAGLAAALSLAEHGREVVVHEAAPAPGGRCRSYWDSELNERIDNGNHLLLSGNHATMAYLDQIGGHLAGPRKPIFPFHDLQTGQSWVLHLNDGPTPWWVLARSRRVPGTRLRDYMALRRLLREPPAADQVVADFLPRGELSRRLLLPFAVSALNTPPAAGSASLLAAVMRESLAKGGGACLPWYAPHGLSESFITPALARLRRQDAQLRLRQRVVRLNEARGAVVGLETSHGPEQVGPFDAVVLAVPPSAAARLLPGLVVPNEYGAILNLHFRYAAPPGPAGFIGLIGGLAEWAFMHGNVVSVTISAADHLLDQPDETLAARVWGELRAALALPDTAPQTPPPYRVLREKRATFAATPAQDRLRPGPGTRLANLALAGDWTATGLPATIEGAIRSGRRAAALLMSPPNRQALSA